MASLKAELAACHRESNRVLAGMIAVAALAGVEFGLKPAMLLLLLKS